MGYVYTLWLGSEDDGRKSESEKSEGFHGIFKNEMMILLHGPPLF
jgi:hypothetical protein